MVVLVILLGSVVVYQQLEIAGLNSSLSNIQQGIESNSTFPEVPLPTGLDSAITTNDTLGLELELVSSPGFIYPGQFIRLVMTVSNTLPTSNNLTVAKAGMSPFTGCWTFPGNLYVIPGLYTSDNISQGMNKSVGLIYPGIYNCPVALHIDQYSFAPDSSNLTLMLNSTTGYGYTAFSQVTASYSLPVNGYWTGGVSLPNPPSFHVFPQGIYTVYAVDPWNQTVFEYFEVTTAVG